MRVKLLFVLVIFLFPSAQWSTAENWHQFRGPNRNDVSSETGLLKSWPSGGPKLLWKFEDAGIGYSGMAVVNNRLYSLGGYGAAEHLYLIDLNTRKRVWSVDIGDLRTRSSAASDGPCSTPTIDGDRVYALGGCGRLVCADGVTGKLRWSKDLEEMAGEGQTHYGYVESPLVDGDQVIATPGGAAGAVAAFDKHTGALKWRSAQHIDMVRCGSPIAIEVNGVRQYVQATQGHVVGLKSNDGSLLWRVPTNQVVAIICEADCIYISPPAAGSGGALLKLRSRRKNFEVEEIYVRGKISGNFGGGILTADHLYGACGGAWLCQNFRTGKLVWRKRCDLGNEAASVTFADGCIYGYWFQKGDVQLLRATTAGFKEKGKFRIPQESKNRKGRRGLVVHPPDIWPRPVVANGKLYLRDQEVIYCYDIRCQ